MAGQASGLPTQAPTPLQLFQQLVKNPDTSGWSDFIANPKGFFQDVSKVSKYSPELGKVATSNPSEYFASYDQFLKGTNSGSQPGSGGAVGSVQYEGDPAYYRPIVSANLGQWYDYKNNAFKNLGDGFGQVSPPGGSTPPTNQVPDTTPVLKKPKPKGEEYVYGRKNPYLDTLLQMGQAGKNKNPRAPLGMGQYGNLDMLKNLMDR